MTYEIIKISPNEHHIVKTETKEVVSVYTRMSSAKRGLERLLAKEAVEQEVATVCTEQESASATATQRAQARGGVGAVAQPPASNTGGLNGASAQRQSADVVSEKTSVFVNVGGQVKEIPLRKGKSTCAHIDTLTLTMTQEVFIEHELKIDDDNLQNVELLARKISETVYSLFGFGIYEQKNGINGYKYSFKLGTDNANYGVVAFGGKNQKDSILLHFTGDGLTAALDGWETRLHAFIQAFAPHTKITRCDLAHDFLDGEYTPDMALQDWINGGFTQKHTRPKARQHGYDWLDEQYPEQSLNTPKNKGGKTFYVGTPKSSRMLRVYEKGCELGDKKSNWVRFELQLRNRDYLIPHDILIRAGGYLCGAYPICEDLFFQHEQDMSKAERVSKINEISIAHIIYYASQAVSPAVNMLQELGFDDREIVVLLKGGKFKLPERILLEKYDCEQANVKYLHELASSNVHSDVFKFMKNFETERDAKKFHERMNKQYDFAEKELATNALYANFTPNQTHFLQLS